MSNPMIMITIMISTNVKADVRRRMVIFFHKVR